MLDALYPCRGVAAVPSTHELFRDHTEESVLSELWSSEGSTQRLEAHALEAVVAGDHLVW